MNKVFALQAHSLDKCCIFSYHTLITNDVPRHQQSDNQLAVIPVWGKHNTFKQMWLLSN